MQEILNTAWEYRYIITYVIIGIISVILMDKNVLKIKVVEGIALAKKLSKDMILNSGQEQEDYVVAKIYPLLPLRIRVFVSEERFRQLVKISYQKIKDYLDDGEFNGSQK
jgi:hypothetical protein